MNEKTYPAWTDHAQHVNKHPDCHLCQQPQPIPLTRKEHGSMCPKLLFWDSGEYEAPCTCVMPVEERTVVNATVHALLTQPDTVKFFVEKAGTRMRVLGMGEGRIPKKCNKEMCCKGKDRYDRYDLLPCGHHAFLRLCTCKYRDKQCGGCDNVYISLGNQWYQVEDPHPPRRD